MHAQRLAPARHQEQQRHARVVQDVAQRIQPVVAAPIGQDQRVVVRRIHEAWRIAARRHMRPVPPAGRQQAEGAGGQEGARRRPDPVRFLVHHELGRLGVERGQRLEAGDGVRVGRKAVHRHSLPKPRRLRHAPVDRAACVMQAPAGQAAARRAA
jgi:hypothetical protein